MSESSDKGVWLNLGAFWRPDSKEVSYKLSGRMDAGQLLAAAHVALARGERDVRVFVYGIDDKDRKSDKAPHYRISAPISEREEQGGGGGGDDDRGGDDGDRTFR